MILGPDGRPAREHPSHPLLSLTRLLAQFQAQRAFTDRVDLLYGRRLLGPDGRPLYSAADTRAGRTISVKLPDRFRTTTKERP